MEGVAGWAVWHSCSFLGGGRCMKKEKEYIIQTSKHILVVADEGIIIAIRIK